MLKSVKNPFKKKGQRAGPKEQKHDVSIPWVSRSLATITLKTQKREVMQTTQHYRLFLRGFAV